MNSGVSDTAPKRIGIYGGSFDPVHNAHLALARTALAHLQLDLLLWVPAGQPPQKVRKPAPSNCRAAMIALAIADEPRFALDRCELERDGVSYTIDTVRHLQGARDARDAWFLLIGADQFANLTSWRGWRELVGRVTLAVAGRPGHVTACSDALRDQLAVAGCDVCPLPLPPIELSSTQVRVAVAAGHSIAAMVPEAVGRYIDDHRLYAGDG